MRLLAYLLLVLHLTAQMAAMPHPHRFAEGVPPHVHLAGVIPWLDAHQDESGGTHVHAHAGHTHGGHHHHHAVQPDTQDARSAAPVGDGLSERQTHDGDCVYLPDASVMLVPAKGADWACGWMLVSPAEPCWAATEVTREAPAEPPDRADPPPFLVLVALRI